MLAAFGARALDGIVITSHYDANYGKWPSIGAMGVIHRYVLKGNEPIARKTLAAADSIRYPILSKDGKNIAFFRKDGAICVMDIHGRYERELTQLPGIGGKTLDWPAGDWIYYSGAYSADAMKVNCKTGEVVKVFTSSVGGFGTFHLSSDATKAIIRTGKVWYVDMTAADPGKSAVWIDACNDMAGFSCGNGISPDGNWIMDGWYGHFGMTIKKYGSCTETHSDFEWSATNSWNVNSVTACGGKHMVLEKWSCNSNKWMVVALGAGSDKMTLALINPFDKQRITVTPNCADGGFDLTGDFWEGDPSTVLADSSSGAKPFMQADKKGGYFHVDSSTTTPTSITITVANTTDGTTLDAITVADNPPWLNVVVSGNGNTQTITNTVDISKLPSADTVLTAFCAVSAANAANGAGYVIECHRGTLRKSESPGALTAGLNYELWDESIRYFQNMDQLGAPVKTGAVANIDYDLVGLPSNFNFTGRFTGYFYARQTGIYEFQAITNNGAAVLIGDEQVVWGNGPNANGLYKGTIALEAGYHSLTVLHHQTNGGYELKVQVGTATSLMLPIASSVLFRKNEGGTQEPVQVLSPNSEGTYAVGDALVVKWLCDPVKLTEPVVEFSGDGGITWNYIAGKPDSVFEDLGSGQYKFTWTIPESLTIDQGKIATVSNNCMIRVLQYSNEDISDVCDAKFAILSSTGAGRMARSRVGPLMRIKGNAIVLGQAARVDIMTINGRVIDRFTVKTAGVIHAGKHTARGVYIIDAISLDGKERKTVKTRLTK
jgi:hypothetical protein